MPFIRIPGSPGRFYVTASKPVLHRRFACTDCRVCQWCSEVRCRACRATAGKNGVTVRPAAPPSVT